MNCILSILWFGKLQITVWESSPFFVPVHSAPNQQESSQKRRWNLSVLKWTNICLTLWLLLVTDKRNPMTFSPWTAFRLKPLLHKWKYSVYGIREDTCHRIPTSIALFRPISAFIMWKLLLLGNKWTRLRFVVCTWLKRDALLLEMSLVFPFSLKALN